MRLIDADALVSQIRQEPTDGMSTEEIPQIIVAQPTVEAAPVVHGRTEKIEPCRIAVDRQCCSCGTPMGCQDNYCPNCGARMDGDADG